MPSTEETAIQAATLAVFQSFNVGTEWNRIPVATNTNPYNPFEDTTTQPVNDIVSNCYVRRVELQRLYVVENTAKTQTAEWQAYSPDTELSVGDIIYDNNYRFSVVIDRGNRRYGLSEMKRTNEGDNT